MALTEAQDQREHELRVDQMSVNIEKMRKEMRSETRKFVVQLLALVVGAFAAGAAWVKYLQ